MSERPMSVRVGGCRLLLTRHAIERYGERVRPGLEWPVLVRELVEVLRGAELGAERPPWATHSPVGARGWVTLGPDVAFPVVRDRLVTCVDRPGVGAEVRVVRQEFRGGQTERRKGKRRAKHARHGKVARAERAVRDQLRAPEASFE